MNTPIKAPAQFVPPQAGITIDREFDVLLASEWYPPCIRVTMHGFDILLPKTELDALAALQTVSWKTQDERMSNIAIEQAKSLLAGVSPQADVDGCFSAPGKLGSGATAQVFQSIVAGGASILERRSGLLLPSVKLRYQGLRAGPTVGFGHISVAPPDGKAPFMMVNWWRA